MLNFYYILFLASFVTLIVATFDRHQENLKVVPIGKDCVNTFFNFDTAWQYGNKLNMRYTNLVPREISDLLINYDVKELHFSITRGFWMYDKWGYPVAGAPNGVEAWAWFSGTTNLYDSYVESRWIGVMTHVANILSLTLNVDGRSISPKYGFHPRFITSNPNGKYHIRYTISPFIKLENENLRSWKKLLPCGWTHGLSSLLTLKNIKRMKYISLSFHMTTLCYREEECSLLVTQTANLVLDLKLFEGNSNEYSLARLFDHGFNGHCELCTTSTIHLQNNNETNIIIPNPQASGIEANAITAEVLSPGQYDVAKQSDNFFDKMCLIHTNTSEKKPKGETQEKKYIMAIRSISGDGQQGYQLITEITNTYNMCIPLYTLELFPSAVEVNMNSLKIVVPHDNHDLHPKILRYTPAGNKSVFSILDMGLLLKPKSITTIRLDLIILPLKWFQIFQKISENWIFSTYTALLPIGNNYQKLVIEGNDSSELFNVTSIGGYFQNIYSDQITLQPRGTFSYILNKTSVILFTLVSIFVIGILKFRM